MAEHGQSKEINLGLRIEDHGDSFLLIFKFYTNFGIVISRRVETTIFKTQVFTTTVRADIFLVSIHAASIISSASAAINSDSVTQIVPLSGLRPLAGTKTITSQPSTTTETFSMAFIQSPLGMGAHQPCTTHSLQSAGLDSVHAIYSLTDDCREWREREQSSVRYQSSGRLLLIMLDFQLLALIDKLLNGFHLFRLEQPFPLCGIEHKVTLLPALEEVRENNQPLIREVGLDGGRPFCFFDLFSESLESSDLLLIDLHLFSELFLEGFDRHSFIRHIQSISFHVMGAGASTLQVRLPATAGRGQPYVSAGSTRRFRYPTLPRRASMLCQGTGSTPFSYPGLTRFQRARDAVLCALYQSPGLLSVPFGI